MAIPLWLREKLFLKGLLKNELGKLDGQDGWNEKLLFSEHHLSHAASAFFPSPFEEAVVLTMDGVGEWATTSAAIGKGSKLAVHKEIHFPRSEERRVGKEGRSRELQRDDKKNKANE